MLMMSNGDGSGGGLSGDGSDPSGMLVGVLAGTRMFGNLASSYAQATATKTQADYQANQARINSQMAKIQADDATDRGNLSALQEVKKNQLQVGAQRAAGGASGTDVNSGSNVAIQTDAQNVGAFNALVMKNNAVREAYGYKVQATNYRAQAGFDQLAGQNQSTNTLLTGGIKAITSGFDSYDRYTYGRRGSY